MSRIPTVLLRPDAESTEVSASDSEISISLIQQQDSNTHKPKLKSDRKDSPPPATYHAERGLGGLAGQQHSQPVTFLFLFKKAFYLKATKINQSDY